MVSYSFSYCLDCEFLGLDELWSEFYCQKADITNSRG